QERGRRLALIGDILDESRPLLDDLMGLAHPDEGAARMHDLVELVANFHDHARRVIPAAIEMRYEAADLSLPVLVNPRGLEHALWNLVINARQAIDGGGVITMRTGRHAQEAWVEIADTGCGIPETIRPRIFDPYFTTKPPGQGTGLGLAAVERFVRGSNGRIDVASQPGRGTTFRLEFPLLAADGATAASA
ncbi:MAG TPA: ATP-binding protein, partial [Planctomycetota bacterium]|nr:ATP-binding protein [Planctomycetota bacterium]